MTVLVFSLPWVQWMSCVLLARRILLSLRVCVSGTRPLTIMVMLWVRVTLWVRLVSCVSLFLLLVFGSCR